MADERPRLPGHPDVTMLVPVLKDALMDCGWQRAEISDDRVRLAARVLVHGPERMAEFRNNQGGQDG